MSGTASAALATATIVLLSGCAFGPDPVEVADRTNDVFAALTAELAAVDPAIVRTVEIVPEETLACGDSGDVQAALLARGVLSVRASDGAVADVVNTLAASLDGEEWEPAPSDVPEVRAFSNGDGINVTLTDRSPVVVVAVFGPCLPPAG